MTAGPIHEATIDGDRVNVLVGGKWIAGKIDMWQWQTGWILVGDINIRLNAIEAWVKA